MIESGVKVIIFTSPTDNQAKIALDMSREKKGDTAIWSYSKVDHDTHGQWQTRNGHISSVMGSRSYDESIPRGRQYR